MSCGIRFPSIPDPQAYTNTHTHIKSRVGSLLNKNKQQEVKTEETYFFEWYVHRYKYVYIYATDVI